MVVCVFQLGIQGQVIRLLLNLRFSGLVEKELRILFIHCASGHGRSPEVMCALGVVDDVGNPNILIQEKLPSIRMRSPLSRKALEKWSTNRLSLLLKPEPVHTLN